MTIGRAPGSTRRAARPERVARARAHLARRQRRRGAASRTRARARARSSTASRSRAATALHDGAKPPARCADAARRAPPRHEPRRAARSWSSRARAWSCPSLGPPGVPAQATAFGMKPRVRSGYALKRLDASEGSKRWVLKDLNRNTFLRLSDNDAQLFELLDGTHSLADLIGIAEQRFGSAGAPRLARLLADLGERGYLAGVAGARGRRGRGGAAGLPAAAVQAAREELRAGRRLVRGALPPRRLGAVHARPRCTRSRR